jgi:PKD repeat protein
MKRVTLAIAIAAVTFLAQCSNDNGTNIVVQPPTIQSITPDQVSRAEHIVATLHGTNFTGASQVTIGEGFDLQGFTVKSSVEIEIRFFVNPDSPAGERTVSVTTPGGTATQNNLLEVLDNRAPLVKISFLPQNGATNSTFTFDGLSSNDPDGSVTTFEWDFGDGKTASGPIVNHRFRTVGTFTVTLTVTDNKGARGQGTVSVEVQEGIAPQAKFSISPKEGDVNTIFTFNGSSSTDDGTVVSYQWTFGDNQVFTGPIVERDFPAGQVSVSLTVTDDKGLQDVQTKDLLVGVFDEAKAAAEIRAVVYEFFRRYSMLDTLTPEQIVVNWSLDPKCKGRAHEIHIIEQQQTFITKTTATVTGPIEVTFSSHTKAHAIAAAHFHWFETDGSEHDGDATHDFTMVLEDGHWHICDFVLLKQTAGVERIFQ